MRSSRYLITGGAHFIGSHIADVLVAGNHAVVLLDDLSTGLRGNVEHLAANGMSTSLHEGSDRVFAWACTSRWSYAIAKSYGEAIASGYRREHGAAVAAIRRPDTTAVQDLVGWRPAGTLDDALDDVIDFHRTELTIAPGQPDSREAPSCQPTSLGLRPAAPARAA